MKICRLLPVLLTTCCAAFALPVQTTAQVPVAASDIQVLLNHSIDELKAGQPAQSLSDLQLVLAADHNNAIASLYAATAAMELYNGPLAVRYAEQAHRLDPQSWKVHTTLVAAYAAAGMKQQRDEERTTLERLHATGAPDARAASGFLVEMFEVPPAVHAQPLAPTRVEAIQYFRPVGKFHTYYRFLVQRPGHKPEEIDVQSNDFDERSWAQAHPKEAAAGERQFQLTGRGESGEVDYRMFSGSPDYDAIRAMVVKVLSRS